MNICRMIIGKFWIVNRLFYCNVLGIIDNILDLIIEFFVFVYNFEFLINKIWINGWVLVLDYICIWYISMIIFVELIILR